jgi:drug/metabolite transporter (DMT)-like permease
MKQLLPYLALSVPILAWGLSFPSIKAALTEIPPMTLAFGRFVLAAALLLAVCKIKGQKMAISREHVWPLVLSVLSGITLYFLCENHGVKLIPASAASLIIAGIPILTLLADRMVFGRRLGAVGTAAALASFVGAALLVGVLGTSGASANPWGYVLMFGAAVAWVLYLFALKPLQREYPNLVLTTWQMLLGAASLVPFAAAEAGQWRWPSAVGWGHLVFQGLVCSAASFLLYNHALGKLGLRTASLSINLIPVVTVVAAYLFLGELLAPWQWAGGALVLAAVVAVSAVDAPKPAAP